jgi:cobalt-zinc-cadmium efflux system outer membrane protein
MVPPRVHLRPAIVSGLLLAAMHTGAAAPPPAPEAARAISLAEARALAWRLGPEVVLAERREAIARAQVDVAGALGNPTLSVQSARLSARLTTGVGVPLPLFGQRGTAMAAAGADAEAVLRETEALRLDARWSATRAWLDLWEAEARGRLLESAASEAERLAGIAQERFAAGSTPRLDVVRTGADRARARAEARAARSSVAAASARLSIALGAAETAPFTADGPAEVGPLPAARAGLDRALALHPALARDRAQSDAAGAHVRAEQRLRWPVVSAQVAVSQADPTLPGTDVIAGLSFEAPVLNLRAGAIARARAERALADSVTELDTRRLRAELDGAYEQARAAAVRAEAFGKEVLPALEEARRMTEEGYRDGRVDLLRLLEAQRALLDGRGAHVEAQSTAQRALADVERALGAPLDGGTAGAP